MSVFKQIRVRFKGSFQCRLATDLAPTNGSPKGPNTPPQQNVGWTFAYDEPRFDRIIRLANPVALRNLLIDPFTPVKVTEIQVQPQLPFTFPGQEIPFQTVPADAVLNLPVSLGNQVVFDTAAGTGISYEALLNLKFSIGGTTFTADPGQLPILDGQQGADPSWGAEYATRKAALILAAQGNLPPARLSVLTNPQLFAMYVTFFGGRCPTKTIPLTNVNYSLSSSGIFSTLLLLGWSWTLDLAFYRFDGDTLVGQMDGMLSGIHSDL